MKRFRVTFQSKDGSRQVMGLMAADKAEAQRLAERAQYRRHERFPLTFARLEQARETGNSGQLAIDPRFGGKALTEAWVKAETEKRKRDQARYDDGDLKIVSVEEEK
jgi:hypothetical protein